MKTLGNFTGGHPAKMELPCLGVEEDNSLELTYISVSGDTCVCVL